jgi:RNA polymerase sigma-70 factor (ECF subfamily)
MSRTQSLNFKKLVENHFTGLYRFAYCLANDEQTACDLTQHTFFLYANKGALLREGAKIKPWLYATLYSEFLRQRTAPHPEAPGGLPATAPPPVPEFIAALDGPSAAAAFAHLDEPVRAPLALFYLHNLTYPEIAEALDTPVEAVFARVADGKIQLKKILADHADQS